jgi:putative inorganic carbon (HCO3(-)) transporter
MPLRDLLISGILVSTLPFVFRHVFIGVLLWTWVSIMNPHRLAYGFIHNAPIAAAIAGITLLGLFTTRDRVKLAWSAPVSFLAMFVIWTFVTTFFAFFQDGSIEQLIKILKIQLMIFVTIAVLYKWEHIRLFIWINVLSLGFYGLKGGLYTIQGGGEGRVWGPPGGFIAGNNELALALIMAIPLMNFLRLTTPYPWVKRGLIVMMGFSAFSALGTQSRGALLAIVAMGGVLWWRAPNKLINAFALVLLAGVAWTFMPQSWHDRMQTIQTYQEDRSAMGRIYAWQTAINIANDRVFGAGYDMYSNTVFHIYSPNPIDSQFDASIARAAHSIYFQVLGEHGYIGLLLFLMIWFTAWRMAGSLRKGTRDDAEADWLYHFGGMAQVSLVGFAVGGAFLSLAYFDLPYNLMAALVVVQRWRMERQTLPQVAAPIPPDTALTGMRKIQWWVRTA